MTNKTYANPRLDELTAHYQAHGWEGCNRGTNAALRGYIQTDDIGLGTLVVRDMPCTADMPDFLDCLADAGITEFLLCDRSSGLMDALHYLLSEGWQVCGTYENRGSGAPLLGLRMWKGGEAA